MAVIFTVTDPAKTTSNQSTPTATDATTGAKTFSYTYTGDPSATPPQPPDNTYDVQIQGFDRAGRGGPITTISLYINCHEPPDVNGVNGGFDWRRCTNYPVACAAGDRIFDLDWNRSPDADVVGYYVYRVVGTPDFAGGPKDDVKVTCVSRQPAPNDTTTNTTPTRSSRCSATSRCTTSTTPTGSRSSCSAKTGRPRAHIALDNPAGSTQTLPTFRPFRSL